MYVIVKKMQPFLWLHLMIGDMVFLRFQTQSTFTE